MPDAEAAGGKSPVNVEMRTSDPAGTALQAAFIVDGNPVVFQPVNIGRTDVKAGLLPAVIDTNRPVDDFQMGGFMHVKTVQKEFVFD